MRVVLSSFSHTTSVACSSSSSFSQTAARIPTTYTARGRKVSSLHHHLNESTTATWRCSLSGATTASRSRGMASSRPRACACLPTSRSALVGFPSRPSRFGRISSRQSRNAAAACRRRRGQCRGTRRTARTRSGASAGNTGRPSTCPLRSGRKRRCIDATPRRAFWSVPGRTVESVIAAARREEFRREANAAGIVEVDSDDDDSAQEEGGADEAGVPACRRRTATRMAAAAMAAP